MRILLSATLAVIAGSTAAVELISIPLEPGERPTVWNHRYLTTRDGQSTVPFAGGDGSLHFRIDQVGLLIDRNRDGKLTSRDQPALRKDQGFHLALQLGARTVRYPFSVQWLDGERASLVSHFCLVGSKDGTELLVKDRDCDGAFTKKDVVQAGSCESPLGGVVVVGKDMMETALAEDASALLLTPYAGDHGRLVLKGPGFLTFNHRLQSVSLATSPGQESTALAVIGTWAMSGSLMVAEGVYLTLDGDPSVTVAKDADSEVVVGEPDRLEIAASMTSTGQVEITEALLAGQGPLRWQASVHGDDADGATIQVRGAGRTVKLGKIEYG
jgi:hypothetical protein